MSSVTFPTSEPVDFLVLGAGAAGGVVAKELSTAGFNVVVLEQGPYLREKDYTHDEIKYTIQPGLTNDPKTQPITYRRSEADTVKPMKAIEYGRQVGGGSVHFTGNYWRFHESDFHERSLFGDVRGSRACRLAHHVCRSGTLLHEGRVRPWHFRPGRRESLRSATLEAVPAAAHAGQVVGRPVRSSHEEARAAPFPCAGGYSVAAVSRPRSLRELRFLRIVRL